MKNRIHTTMKDLQHYMFTENHIMSLIIDREQVVKNNQKQQTKLNAVSGVKNILDDIFIPKEYDKLFWCYYILVNSHSKYDMLFNNTFKNSFHECMSKQHNLSLGSLAGVIKMYCFLLLTNRFL